jgi:hypothetical protein
VFTARYDQIPYIEEITLSLSKANPLYINPLILSKRKIRTSLRFVTGCK